MFAGSRGSVWAQSFALALLLVGLAVSGVQAQQQQELLELPPQPRRPFTPPEWAPVPDDLGIVVIREDVIPGQFRILDVELSRKVDEEMLGIVANLLRDADDMVYLRTYIVYYLPGMVSGTRGWATSHFLPDLQVRLIDSL